MGQDEDEAAGVAAEAAHSAPSGGVPRPSNAEELGAIGEVGATFLRGLLAAMGLQGTVAVSVSDAELDVTIEGDDLGVLVGPRGQTLASLQEITRIAVQQQTGGAHGRLRVDVGGYWEKRRAALGRFARQVAADVEKTGRSKLLEPMNAADRKVVHDAVSDMAVVTRSQGEDPHRRVLIAPAD